MLDFIEIDFIECGDTGSGDAIAIRHKKNGLDWIYIVDGGYSEDGKKLLDHVHQYYDNPRCIDHVVLTHPDADHASGLETVLKERIVGCLWMNRPWEHVNQLMDRFKYFENRERLIARLKRDFPKVAELEEIARERNIPIKDAFQGDNIGIFTVLSPEKLTYFDLIVESNKTPVPVDKMAAIRAKSVSCARWGEENLKGDTDGTAAENETSIVQFANVCSTQVLLTGDAGVRALTEAHEVAVRQGIFTSHLDWFQVPHHGSRRNLSSEVLNKWLGEKLPFEMDYPQTQAIISANQKDKDHPKKAVIRALIHRGRRVTQTDKTLRVYTSDAPRRDNWSTATPLEYPTEQED